MKIKDLNRRFMISSKKYSLFVLATLIHNLSFAQQKPNVIIILTDDMGYSDIGCFGGDFVPTPNIDRMAQMGTKFTQYYSAAPICSPSRTSILTGNFPARWNFTTFLAEKKQNQAAEQANYLNPNVPSIAQMFKQAGYVTGHFGKWHMGGGRDVDNAPGFEKYGFDEHISTYESPDPDPLITATDWIWSKKDSIKRWDRTKYFVDKTLAFMKSHKGEPCYVNLWPDDVHTPWVPNIGEAYTGKFPLNPNEEKAFKLVLKEYDKQIGRLLDGLKEMGLDKNTIIVFTSDNGPLPSFRGSREAGLRGSKLSLYEGGIRMPFIIEWPGHIPANRVDSASVINSTDLLPSLLNMANIKLPKSYKGDGEDRSLVFKGTPSERKKTTFWEYGRNESAFNFPKGRDKSPNLAIRSENWKLLMDYGKENIELYDLRIDQYENNNIAQENPKIVKKLKAELLKWRKNLPSLTPEKYNP